MGGVGVESGKLESIQIQHTFMKFSKTIKKYFHWDIFRIVLCEFMKICFIVTKIMKFLWSDCALRLNGTSNSEGSSSKQSVIYEIIYLCGG